VSDRLLNFALFAKYPHYTFNFTGANRYRLMKKHCPAGHDKLKRYAAQSLCDTLGQVASR
jgi:hypothetical protein